MANELQIHLPYLSGESLYLTLRNASGQVYDAVAGQWDSPVKADWADYAIALTEQDTDSGTFLATIPAVAAGRYGVWVQSGAAPAYSDTVEWQETILWTGTAIAGLSDYQGAGTLTEEYLDAALEGKTVYATGSSPDDSYSFTVRRGNTVVITFSVSADLVADPTALYVTLKRKTDLADSAALLQVKRTAGAAVNQITYINGQTPTEAGIAATDATVTDIDTDAGTVELTIKPAAAALLKPQTAVAFDVKQINGATVDSLTTGSAGAILADVTRAISA